jgi:hypothetical protein
MKTIRIYFTAVLILLSMNGFAQDTIFMKNLQRIPAIILEVSPTMVKYKRFHLSDGPLYIENKSMIAQIKYRNGFIDIFPETISYNDAPRKPIEYREQKKYPSLIHLQGGKYAYDEKVVSENKMHDILLSLNDVKIAAYVMAAKESKAFKYIGFAALPLGILGGLSMLQSSAHFNYGVNQYTRDKHRRTGFALFGGAALCVGASIYFGINKTNKNRMAVELYQNNYASRKKD